MDAMNAYVVPGIKNKLLTEVDMPRIFNFLCSHYNEPAGKVASKCRKRELVFIRQLFMYLFCYYSKLNLKEIARFFNQDYDHSTVIHSRNHINDLMQSDPEIKQQVEYLKIQCGL